MLHDLYAINTRSQPEPERYRTGFGHGAFLPCEWLVSVSPPRVPKRALETDLTGSLADPEAGAWPVSCGKAAIGPLASAKGSENRWGGKIGKRFFPLVPKSGIEQEV